MKRKDAPSHDHSEGHAVRHKRKRQKRMETAEHLSPRAKDPSIIGPDGRPLNPDHDDAFKQAWRALDEDDEKVTLQMEERFGHLKEKLSHAVPEAAAQVKNELSAQLKEAKAAIAGDVINDPTYDGPHLPEFSVDVSKKLLEAFSKGKLLHEDYATRIFSSMRRLMKKLATVNEISIPAGGRVVVVGDTHGQLTDLITIFRIAGFPSKTNVFLFNGDFVDRGPQDVEIILTLYSLKLAGPDTIFFNRGNHEQRHMNEKYNFENNVRARYDPVIFELVQKTFKYLPLASVIQSKVYVTHGGLFPFEDVTLDEIKGLERWKIKKGKPSDRNTTLMQCMLWSDPHEEQGWKPSDRGAGILWGPDLTKSFLSKNNLELVIRSHEMVDEGTKPFHNDHCITLFSASNYTGTNENQGAVITFSDPANVKNFDVHRYFADAIFEDLKQSTSVKATSEARKSETLQKLRERIFQERHALSLEFFTLDKEQSGKVSVAQFIDALHKASDGRINYTKFLDRYKMAVEADYWDAWANSVVSKLCQSMFAHGFSTVKEAFSSLDKDASGAISYGEFVDALKSFDLGLSEMQMYDLIRSMDSNEDAHIDYDEFLARFESSFSTAAAEEHERDAAKVLLKVSQVVHKHYKTLRDAFSQIDKNDSGRINSKELRSFFKTLPIEDTDTDTLFKILDRDGSGSISYKEFKRALKPRVAKEADESRAFFDGVLQNVCDVLHRSKVQLRAAFRMMDIDGSGKIDVAEFKAGLEALNVLLEVPLSDSQISTLHSVIDKDKDGSISYEEFLASFSVVDKDEQ